MRYLHPKAEMKKILLLSLLGILSFPVIAAQTKLSEEARISLMTSSPYEAEVFTVYGHAAIRVHDPSQSIDYIFNYGIFDFSKPNFVYRFAKGETDYRLGVTKYLDYVIEYQMQGSEITEQVLNLTKEEKEKIWEALLINYQPENRVYRYNFFFDNCATRPATIVEKQVEGEMDYLYPYPSQTFRDLINYCSRNRPWLTFGCDLALGSPTDRMATPHEMMFLPQFLKEAFAHATITAKDKTTRPLVSETLVIKAEKVDERERDIWDTLTPLVCGWILFATILALTGWEWKRKRYFLAVDCILFLAAGAGGIVLTFLSFVSEHPCTWPNWSLIWLHPLHLPAIILFCVKKWKKAAYYYHFINFAALTLMLVGWHFIPQHLNTAFIPLVASLWMRSGWGIYRYKGNIG